MKKYIFISKFLSITFFLAILSAHSSELQDSVRGEVRSVLDPLIEDKLIPGYYLAIYDQNGKQFEDKQGFAAEIDNLEPAEHVLYAIMSMSKPIVSFAALRLVERGDLKLNDPVSKYIPELESLTVVEEGDLDNAQVEASQAITIHHLLTHTSGLTYSQDVTGREEVAEIYAELGIFPIDERTTDGLDDLSDHVEALAQLPLVSHPGERFVYSVSIDVLGRVLEIVRGTNLSEIIDELVLAPLEMKSTFFKVPQSEQARLAQMYRPRVATYPIPGKYLRYQPYQFESGAKNFGLKKDQYLSGGAGLLSSAGDYYKFLNMLLNEGELNGQRLASKSTVQMMFTDQLPDHLGSNGLVYNFGPNALGTGFGYGFGIRTLEEGNPKNADDHDYYFWAGAANTGFWIDKRHGLIGIFMAQHLPTQYDRIPELVQITRSLSN